MGGCGELCAIQHALEGTPPAAFTVQLAWESQREGSSAIADTLAAVSEVCCSSVCGGCVEPVSALGACMLHAHMACACSNA